LFWQTDSLDSLEKSVRGKFAAVPNTDAQFDKFNGIPFEPSQLQVTSVVIIRRCFHFLANPLLFFVWQKIYKVVPVKDLRSVEIFWPIPSLVNFWREQPLHYISHLIRHEGAGSILSLLKKKGWATGLASGSYRECLDFAIYKTSVELTVEGLEHTDEIIGIVFQYINLLKRDGVVQWIFNEVRLAALAALRLWSH